MSAERWLPVVGYEGVYEVSDQGRVRSLDRDVVDSNGIRKHIKGLIRRSSPTGPLGYRNVSLSMPRQRQRTPLVHHLVMAAFVGPMPDGLEVLHGDDDPGNNRLANLRYGTRSENIRECVARGRHANASKAKCVNGHEFTPENTCYRRTGGRYCRRCNSIKAIRNRKRSPQDLQYIKPRELQRISQ